MTSLSRALSRHLLSVHVVLPKRSISPLTPGAGTCTSSLERQPSGARDINPALITLLMQLNEIHGGGALRRAGESRPARAWTSP